MSLEIVRRPLPGWGTTYGPSGDGAFPAVMLLHGSEGAGAGWSHRNAVVLAAHGFLAFPLGYSKGGNAWNAGHIVDVPLDRSVDALAALRAFPHVGPKVGLFGSSRGAEHALLLAALMARDDLPGLPDALAVHSPPDVVCGAFDARMWRDRGDPGWQVWDPGKRAWTWRGGSEDLLPTTPIEVERYAGPIYISHGTADRVWSVDMTHRLVDRLRGAGRTPEVHLYEGQDHQLDDAAENQQSERLISFWRRHLAG